MKKFILIIVLAAFSIANAQSYKYYKNIMSKEEYKNLDDGLYALLQTNQGDMLVELYDEDAPLTVANFVGLAEGTKKNDAKAPGEPYYDGTIFHRVIKDFMIQGGDPQGTGVGGPGYKFQDEKNDKTHDSKGVLSMANSGPNTNGSQFFITEVPTPWLNGKHTIFGKVVSGDNVIDTIANVPKGAQDKPVDDVVLEKVTIIRKGKEYKDYDGNASFARNEKNVDERNSAFEEKQKQKELAEKQARVDQINKWSEQAQPTDSGLRYYKLNTTEGQSPQKGQNLSVHYKGMLEDGTVFDSSYDRNQPIEFPADSGKMIKGWDEGVMLLNKGEKAVLFIPSDLGYGERGAGGVIPPGADLVFEIELVDIK